MIAPDFKKFDWDAKRAFHVLRHYEPALVDAERFYRSIEVRYRPLLTSGGIFTHRETGEVVVMIDSETEADHNEETLAHEFCHWWYGGPSSVELGEYMVDRTAKRLIERDPSFWKGLRQSIEARLVWMHDCNMPYRVALPLGE